MKEGKIDSLSREVCPDLKNRYGRYLKNNYIYLLPLLLFAGLSTILLFKDLYYPSSLRIVVKGPVRDSYQVFYDIGDGYRKMDSLTTKYSDPNRFSELAFYLPPKKIKGIIIDPGTHEGIIGVKTITLRSYGHKEYIWTASDIINVAKPLRQIGEITLHGDAAYVVSTGNDPKLELSTDEVERINSISIIGKRYLFSISFLLALFLFISLRVYRKVEESPRRTEYQRIGSGVFFSVTTVMTISSAIVSLPISIHEYMPGIDPSWIFAMNYIFMNGLGHHLVWTGGPFEFIVYPMNLGNNLAIATSIQIVVWAAFFAVYIFYVVYRKVPLFRQFLFLILFSTGSLFVSTFDYLIAAFVLLLLSITLNEKRWLFPYVGALLLTAFTWYLKFSHALTLTATVGFFILLSFLTRKEGAFRQAVLAACLLPLLVLVTYLFYNPHPGDFFYFLKGIFEISSGYGGAMSISAAGAAVVGAKVILAVYLFVAAYLFYLKEGSYVLSILLLVPLFLAFKEGFVRQDIHVYYFFHTSCVLFGIIFLFTRIGKSREYVLYSFIALFVIVTGMVAANKYFLFTPETIQRQKEKLGYVINYPDIRQYLDGSKENLDHLKLSEEWLGDIGKERVGIFPWELSYAAVNTINYEPFPVFQSYSAYTSYLDNLNSEYLEDGNRGSKYIIMEWKAIDGRHPLADVPAMWLSLYRWYTVDKIEQSKILLIRRPEPRFGTLDSISSGSYHVNDSIKIPDSDHPIIAKIYLDLTTRGKITKLLYRIPEIGARLSTANGSVSFRVISDTLRDGLLINYLPQDLSGVADLLNDNYAQDGNIDLRLYGRGMDYFKDEVVVEFLEISDIEIGRHK